MKTYKFTAYGEPVAKGRPRFTKAGFTYTPKKTVIAEEAIRLQSLSAKPAVLIEGPIDLTITFFRSIPKSFSKKKRKLVDIGQLLPVTRPDLDNCVKTIKDALNKVYWNDDSQIVNLVSSKRYSEEPRTEVEVREVGNG